MVFSEHVLCFHDVQRLSRLWGNVGLRHKVLACFVKASRPSHFGRRLERGFGQPQLANDAFPAKDPKNSVHVAFLVDPWTPSAVQPRSDLTVVTFRE